MVQVEQTKSRDLQAEFANQRSALNKELCASSLPCANTGHTRARARQSAEQSSAHARAQPRTFHPCSGRPLVAGFLLTMQAPDMAPLLGRMKREQCLGCNRWPAPAAIKGKSCSECRKALIPQRRQQRDLLAARMSSHSNHVRAVSPMMRAGLPACLISALALKVSMCAGAKLRAGAMTLRLQAMCPKPPALNLW